jgi:hypothetical protein
MVVPGSTTDTTGPRHEVVGGDRVEEVVPPGMLVEDEEEEDDEDVLDDESGTLFFHVPVSETGSRPDTTSAMQSGPGR